MQTGREAAGNMEAAGLAHSRIQLHSAAQLVAAVRKALARPEPDDSHTNLEWNSENNAFASVNVDQPPVQAWLKVLSLTLVVSETRGEQKQHSTVTRSTRLSHERSRLSPRFAFGRITSTLRLSVYGSRNR